MLQRITGDECDIVRRTVKRGLVVWSVVRYDRAGKELEV